MFKKVFKWILRLMLGVIMILVISYGGFHLWEYSTGKKYVRYLKNNSQTIPLKDSFQYTELSKDIEDSELILVGEIHGFKEPCLFDVDFFKYLNSQHNVVHYLAEVDAMQALYLNEYLRTGNELLLKKALQRWVVAQGRNNLDYYKKFVGLRAYYKTLPEHKRFTFIGIDKFREVDLLEDYLNSISSTTIDEFPDKLDAQYLINILDQQRSGFDEKSDTFSLLSHIRTNLEYLKEGVDREEVMYRNFHDQYTSFNLSGKKLYGFFGLYHVLQYRVNGKHTLASKIRRSDLGLEGKILSFNFMMNDSYMVMPSAQLPEFMRDPGSFTRMPVTADNMLFMYIVGIKDFKRMTPEYHKSLIKMDGQESPFSGSIRLNKTIQLLPVTDLFEMTDKGKAYVQYTVFVRNSDWAEPMTTE